MIERPANVWQQTIVKPRKGLFVTASGNSQLQVQRILKSKKVQLFMLALPFRELSEATFADGLIVGSDRRDQLGNGAGSGEIGIQVGIIFHNFHRQKVGVDFQADQHFN